MFNRTRYKIKKQCDILDQFENKKRNTYKEPELTQIPSKQHYEPKILNSDPVETNFQQSYQNYQPPQNQRREYKIKDSAY